MRGPLLSGPVQVKEPLPGRGPDRRQGLPGRGGLPYGASNPLGRVRLYPGRGQLMQPPRQPCAVRDDAPHHTRFGPRTEIALDDQRGVGGIQRRQRQPPGVSGGPLNRAQPGIRTLRPVGGNDQQAQPRRSLGRRLQQRNRGRTRLVHIVKNEQDRPPSRRPHQAGGRGLPALRPGVLTGHLDCRAAPVRVVGKLGRQPGTAAPGRARHKHHTTPPALRIGPEPAQAEPGPHRGL